MTRPSHPRTEITVLQNWIAERRDRKYKIREVAGAMQFTLHQETAYRWKLSGKSCEGSRLRERLTASSLEEAIGVAAALLDPHRAPVQPEQIDFDLAEAFAISIKAGHGQAENKNNQVKYASYFSQWAEQQGITLWKQLRREHLDGYVNHLAEGGYRRKTILNYLEAVRCAARYLAACYPESYRDFTAGFRLRGGLGEVGLYDDEDGTEALTIAEVLEFHAWLGTHAYGRTLQVGVLLGGLVGLRVREIVYLTWQNVDLTTGTVIVQDEEGHRVKNRYSVRKLPVPAIVLDALRTIPRTSGRVLRVEEERYYHPQPKKDFLSALQFYYSWMLNRALREWRPTTKLTARGLRRTIQTAAILNPGWNTYVVDRYCGHAPKSVMERHYFGDQRKRMVEIFRQQVVPRIEEEVRGASCRQGAENGTIGHKTEVLALSDSAQIIDLTEVAE